MENNTITSSEYIQFVSKTTSPASANVDKLLERINELDNDGIQLSRLLTFALGASAETGEAVEIVKKCLLQGKPFDGDAKIHLLKEVSDTFWYIAQLCLALDVTFEDIMKINFDKLSARYPEGHFTVNRSENRKTGDI